MTTTPASHAAAQEAAEAGLGLSEAGEAEVRAAPSGGLLAGLVRTARPKQWVKNVLVVAAPLAAAKVNDAHVLKAVLISFVAFCFAASTVYFCNDALDVESDRAHPTKRFRPIAAGIVPVKAAYVAACFTGAIALGIAALANVGTVAVIAVYLAMHILYSAWFKHVLVLDLAMVAAGFLLRAMLGGVAANLPLSQWFLLTTGFGSLFMVAGKRYSEMVVMGEDAARSRKSLAEYSISYLRFVWQMATALTIITYSLWAFSLNEAHKHQMSAPWIEISVVPWCFVFLRYAMYIDNGKAGEPEDVVLGDRVIVVIGAIWLALFVLGVFHV